MKRKNPETSNEAYHSLDAVKIKSLHKKILSALEALGTGTYEDVAAFLDEEPVRVWKRFSELHRDHLIHRTGERKVMKSGRQGFVWASGAATAEVEKKKRVMKGKSVVDYSKAILHQPKPSTNTIERLF